MRLVKHLITFRGDKSKDDIEKCLAVSCPTLTIYEFRQRVPRDEIKMKITNYSMNLFSIFYLLIKFKKRMM